MKRTICFIKGHEIISGLYEDDEVIQVKICNRCKKGFGKMIYKPFKTISPPGSDASMIASWEYYFDKKIEHARNNLEIL